MSPPLGAVILGVMVIILIALIALSNRKWNKEHQIQKGDYPMLYCKACGRRLQWQRKVSIVEYDPTTGHAALKNIKVRVICPQGHIKCYDELYDEYFSVFDGRKWRRKNEKPSIDNVVFEELEQDLTSSKNRV